ncbi:MAG TPA: hypothetical protein DIU15_11935, partial [Deltaproteobacteria bacterium]|nr:hypothetical protein [Deltaproteobacteria bacterium]
DATGDDDDSPWDDDDMAGPGDAPHSAFGIAIASGGDVNGDGIDDVLVGAPQLFHQDSGALGGAVFLYFGSESSLSSEPSWSTLGHFGGGGMGMGVGMDSEFGFSVAIVPDVNEDGFDDILVGAPSAPEGTMGQQVGVASLYLGSDTELTGGSIDAQEFPDIIIEGNAFATLYPRFSETIAGGDFNGDGIGDILIGAPGDALDAGTIYLFTGPITEDLDYTDADWDYTDPDPGHHLGASLASAGDVNGDGYDDILVGAPQTRVDPSITEAGAALLFFGAVTTPGSTSDWSTYGTAAYDQLGTSLAGGGDVNGDGYDDILITIDMNSSDSEVHLYLGAPDGPSTTPFWSSDAEIGDGYGYSLALNGDLNKDGLDDILIGSDKADVSRGEVRSYHGMETGVLPWAAASRVGSAQELHFGAVFSPVGDFDGDSVDDLLIGTAVPSSNSATNGSIYVYRGGSGGIGSSSAPHWELSSVLFGDQFGSSVLGLGDLNGDSLAEIAIGAPRAPQLGTGDSIGTLGRDAQPPAVGAVAIYAGSSVSTATNPAPLPLKSFQGTTSAEQFGASMAAGDFNDDGMVDLAITAPGKGSGSGAVNVYLGPLRTHSETADATIEGSVVAGDLSADQFADAIVVGDFDCDGVDDLAISAPGESNSANTGVDPGTIRIFEGSSSFTAGTTFWDGSEDQLLYAQDLGDVQGFAYSMAAAGDVDGDGCDDLLVGAPHNDATASSYVNLYLGSSGGLPDTTAEIRTLSDTVNMDSFGAVVAAAGDLNADGYADFVVG